MTTLAEFMIIAGADNCPLMLEKSLYDSWKSRMELYIENQENGRMILNSVQNGVTHDYEIWQMDVKTTFINGKLTEDVFMAQPEGFENASADESCIYVKVSGSVVVDVLSSIMYAMTCTRPDVSFTLSMVSRHQQNPGEVWLDILAEWGMVTWKSSKQDTMAESTCESEYIAACEASKEAIRMKNFIGDLGVVPTVQDSIEIFCNNKSAVALTKEPKDHEKSKHIKRKYHFVRSKVEEGYMIVKHIRSEDNLVDPFTKALAKSRHDEHARSIGLKDNIQF
nr:putative zinc finger, CCHC-type [Tanacetum cinerariifolium]